MDNYKQTLKDRIVEKHGSLAEWIELNDVHSRRFYNFLKGEYNPTIATLTEWLNSVELVIKLEPKG